MKLPTSGCDVAAADVVTVATVAVVVMDASWRYWVRALVMPLPL